MAKNTNRISTFISGLRSWRGKSILEGRARIFSLFSEKGRVLLKQAITEYNRLAHNNRGNGDNGDKFFKKWPSQGFKLTNQFERYQNESADLILRETEDESQADYWRIKIDRRNLLFPSVSLKKSADRFEPPDFIRKIQASSSGLFDISYGSEFKLHIPSIVSDAGKIDKVGRLKLPLPPEPDQPFFEIRAHPEKTVNRFLHEYNTALVNGGGFLSGGWSIIPYYLPAPIREFNEPLRLLKSNDLEHTEKAHFWVLKVQMNQAIIVPSFALIRALKANRAGGNFEYERLCKGLFTIQSGKVDKILTPAKAKNAEITRAGQFELEAG